MDSTEITVNDDRMVTLITDLVIQKVPYKDIINIQHIDLDPAEYLIGSEYPWNAPKVTIEHVRPAIFKVLMSQEYSDDFRLRKSTYDTVYMVLPRELEEFLNAPFSELDKIKKERDNLQEVNRSIREILSERENEIHKLKIEIENYQKKPFWKKLLGL